MGTVAAEKEHMRETLRKRMLHLEELARIEYARDAKVDSGAMAICAHCSLVINYQEDTILVQQNGSPYGRVRKHVCGKSVIRTTWAAVRELLSS